MDNIKEERNQIKMMANAIRFLTVDAIEKSKSGHPGMPLGMADVATVLFTKFLKTNPQDMKWFDRDRFVLSAGHGSMLLYSLLYLLGNPEVTIDDIKNFRQLGSKTAGHPEYGKISGIDTTTGPLGQGLSTAVGMAIAERHINAKYGDKLCNHYTYVMCGDGCLMEGISEEAIALAGHLKLNKLIVFWDNNNITIDGKVTDANSTDQRKRFEACGWKTIEIDGHNPQEIELAIEEAQKSEYPTLISCKTIIGYGAPTKSGTSKCHGSPLGAEETQAMRQQLNWHYAPFEIPEAIRKAWLEAGKKNLSDYQKWEETAKKSEDFQSVIKNELPKDWNKDLENFKEQCLREQTKVATRKASEYCLERIVPNIPEIIGGSADLAASNLTYVKGMETITKTNYGGNNIMYGIREHAMGAIMNGMALHGGVIPYGGTFFVFSDYMRPSMRLSALMGLRVIYVLTHDSIGVGEDGPTHQPIEHLASFRAMPNILVFRPCDIIETAEAWQIALQSESEPSILALSRQSLPLLRKEIKHNETQKGGYVISGNSEQRQATILASGSEVSLAVAAQKELEKKGIHVAVVSIPCWELFDKQNVSYRKQVLGSAPRIAVEAASGFGWEKYVGDDGQIISMNSFGESGPAEQLYSHFGIDVEHIIKAVEKSIK